MHCGLQSRSLSPCPNPITCGELVSIRYGETQPLASELLRARGERPRRRRANQNVTLRRRYCQSPDASRPERKRLSVQVQRSNVRFGSHGSRRLRIDFRLTHEIGLKSDIGPCPVRADSYRRRPLLYHLVGALLDGQRHVDAKGLGGLEVHHEFKCSSESFERVVKEAEAVDSMMEPH